MRIVLLGAPGSGKRTQTKHIVEKYGIPAICTGELLKNAVAQGTELGQQVKLAMEAGHSVSEEVVLELIQERLLQTDAQQGFVLDGFPRNILQAITLDELLVEIQQPLELALLLSIETDALMERLVGRRTCRSCSAQYNIYTNPTAVDGVCDLCGGRLRHRADDNEETISSRLHIYDHLATPLIKHYGKQGKLKWVDGFGEIDEVFARICQIIDTHEPPQGMQWRPETPVEPLMETELIPVPEENPMRQLIPTGLESAEQSQVPGNKRVPTEQDSEQKKRVGAVAVDKIPKKRKSKVSSREKVKVSKTAVAADKQPKTKKQATAKKKTAPARKSGSKQGVKSKKPLTSNKKSTEKPKTIEQKRPVANTSKKKKLKKQSVKKGVASKKSTLAKKKVVQKKSTVSSKKTIAKKQADKKKLKVKKKLAKKQVVKKKTAKKAVRKKS